MNDNDWISGTDTNSGIGSVSIFSSLLVLTIFATVASSSRIAPTLLGQVVVVSLYGVLLLATGYLHTGYRVPRMPLLVFLLIYGVFVVNLIRIYTGLLEFPGLILQSSASMYANIFVYTTAYIVGSATTIFVIPSWFDRNYVFSVVSIISAVTVLIGLLTYAVGDFNVGSITIRNYTSIQPLRGWGISVPAMASYFQDANAMSKFALAGTFCSLYYYLGERSRLGAGLLVVNSLGLFLGNSRSALLGAMLGAMVFLTYVRLGRRSLRVFLLAGGSIAIPTAVVLVSPATESFFGISFSGRLFLWQKSLNAIAANPLLGAGIYEVGQTVNAYTALDIGGLAPQNSYLRVIVATGILGGSSYIGLLCWATLKHVSTVRTARDAVTLALFVAFLVVHFTDTVDPFGMNKNSMVFGLALGYVLQDIYHLSGQQTDQ
jgi:hypothetical protein